MPNARNIEDLLEQSGSKYVLATAIAKRAKEINSGAKITVDHVDRKPEVIATLEIVNGNIPIKYEQPNA